MHEPGGEFTDKIINLAIEVHRQLGPGLPESVYESALCIELGAAGIPHHRQKAVPAIYKGRTIGEYRLDLLVDGRVVVEVKSVERHDPVFEAQLLTYLKLTGVPVGLLLNFNKALLRQGIKRLVLT